MQCPRLLHRVDLLQARIPQQAQPSNAKVGVEDVHHIPRSIGEATLFGILHMLASECAYKTSCVTWHCRMKLVNFSPSIQCSLSSMAMLLITHQL